MQTFWHLPNAVLLTLTPHSVRGTALHYDVSSRLAEMTDLPAGKKTESTRGRKLSTDARLDSVYTRCQRAFDRKRAADVRVDIKMFTSGNKHGLLKAQESQIPFYHRADTSSLSTIG